MTASRLLCSCYGFLYDDLQCRSPTKACWQGWQGRAYPRQIFEVSRAQLEYAFDIDSRLKPDTRLVCILGKQSLLYHIQTEATSKSLFRVATQSAADARQLEHLVANNPFDDFKFAPIRESQVEMLSVTI